MVSDAARHLGYKYQSKIIPRPSYEYYEYSILTVASFGDSYPSVLGPVYVFEVLYAGAAAMTFEGRQKNKNKIKADGETNGQKTRVKA